jgi:hypothetical protein
MGSIANSSAAIVINGDKSARIKLEIPMSERSKITQLMDMCELPLRITINVDQMTMHV